MCQSLIFLNQALPYSESHTLTTFQSVVHSIVLYFYSVHSPFNLEKGVKRNDGGYKNHLD